MIRHVPSLYSTNPQIGFRHILSLYHSEHILEQKKMLSSLVASLVNDV